MTFSVGDVVKSTYRDGDRYLATVEEENGDGTYTLAWLDGDSLDRVKAAGDLVLMRYEPSLQCYQEVPKEVAVNSQSVQAANDSDWMEVLIHHPFLEGEVAVTLPRRAKFKHVKKGLARALGHEGILSRGELMRREGGKYRGYKDGDYIGAVREVLVTSTEFGRCEKARRSVSLDDGEVSMEEGDVALRGARSSGSRDRPAQDDALHMNSAEDETPEETIERLLRLKESAGEKFSAWAALQLGPGASESEVTRQYRRLSMRIHPDKCGLARASEAFQVLMRAHDCLKGRRIPGAAEQEAAASGVEDGLTLLRAMSLLRDLRAAFLSPDFRSKLDTLEFQQDCYSSTTEFLRDKNALFSTVHGTVLPKHGFEGNQSGVYRMLAQMAQFQDDEEFCSLASELNSLLGVNLMPGRWGRVASACKRHEAVAKPKLALTAGDCLSHLLRGGAVTGALGQLARRPVQAAPKDDVNSQQPWPAEKKPPFRLHIAGSWSDFRPEVMRWEHGLFLYQVVVTSTGSERFHLLKNGSQEGMFYPDAADASPFEGFTIVGPDGEGWGQNWQIGKFAEEQMRPGSHVVVAAGLNSQGCLATVDWQAGQLPSLQQGKAPAGGAVAPPEDAWAPWDDAPSPWQKELDALGA